MLLSIAFAACGLALAGSAKTFEIGPAEHYPHQVSDNVVVGAQMFDSHEATEPAFGKKADLNRYGILPVLVVIQNNRQQTLDLHDLRVSLEATGGRHVRALSPDDVPFVAISPNQPTLGPRSPLKRNKKNPLNVPAIDERAFSAKMLPAGQKAAGFFYFQARPETGLKLYLTGIVERPSGKELLYYEVTL